MSEPGPDALTLLLRRAPVGHALWRASEWYVLSRIEMPEPILDLGCGDGLLASVLMSGQVLAGVDLRLGELLQARRTGSHRLLLNGDATSLAIRSGAFGTVLSNCVMEHIPRLHSALSEVTRVLRPGGKFVFTAPSEKFNELLFYPRVMRRFRLYGLARAYENMVNRTFRHYHLFSPEEWIGHLRAAGMHVEETRYFLPPETMRLWDLFLPISVPAKVSKMLFGRWTIGTRQLVTAVWHKRLTRLMTAPCNSGGGLVIQARKPDSGA
ncbi:MAG: class I SAM-dependent methyltransferase [Armatimonadota bacterium]